MNFLLSREQLMLQDQLKGLLREICPARRLHAIIDGRDTDTGAIWTRLVEFGAPAIAVPEAFGGLGLGMVDLALVAEALGEYAIPAPFLGSALAAIAISAGGDAAQRQRWLPGIASGELTATVALNEGESRWLPHEWRLAGGPRLTGTKSLVPNAATANLIVVGVAGGGLAVVETAAAAGTIATRPLASVDRTRPLDAVDFADTPAETLPNAAEATGRLVDAAAILLAADAFGGASHCVELSVEYAKTRVQFGQPIGAFQGLKHQLANMALAVEPVRGLFWYAAHAYDELPDKVAHAAAQAKAHAATVFLQAARDMVEAHGGIGFTWEHDAHIYLKRAMFDWTWLGDPGRHRLRAADLNGWLDQPAKRQAAE